MLKYWEDNLKTTLGMVMTSSVGPSIDPEEVIFKTSTKYSSIKMVGIQFANSHGLCNLSLKPMIFFKIWITFAKVPPHSKRG
jgi:hypothetical protein